MRDKKRSRMEAFETSVEFALDGVKDAAITGDTSFAHDRGVCSALKEACTKILDAAERLTEEESP